MNGDLSLSQSLGGLRIANPDGGEGKPGASSPSQTPASPSGRSRAPVSPISPARSPGSPQNPYAPAFNAEGGLDVASSLGFDPTAFAVHHQATPAPQLASPPAMERPHPQQRLSHRQSMPIAQQAQEQNYYAARSPNPNYFDSRPSTGSYRQPNMYAGSRAGDQESSYQRLRAESNQSNSSQTGRTQSQAAAAAAMGMAMRPSTNRNPSSRSQASSRIDPMSSSYPPRRSSRPSQPSHDDEYSLHRPLTTPNFESTNPIESAYTPSQNANDDWHERGAAVGTSRTTDKDGKMSSKAVKKGVKDFNFGRTLGEGSYSTVLSAKDLQSTREYAIKVLDKAHIIKEKKVKYVNIERDTLNRLTDHPGVVRLYYTFQDARSLYFVLDLATGGELLGVLKKTTSFDEECTRFYSAQILDTVEYMHLRGIIHRDLKPENVLLDDQMHVKITDFGTAKLLDISGQPQFGQVSVSDDPMDGANTDRAVSFVGTAEYVSPELLTDKNACKASDLWAFGCMVYQLLAGRPPFKAANEYLTFQKIVNLDYSFPEGFPPVARDLVEKLLVLDPARRLPIPGIKRHRFFEGVEWGKGLWKQKPPRLRPHRPFAQPQPQRPPTHSNGPSGYRAPEDSTPPSIPKHRDSKTSQPSTSSNTNVARPMPKVITSLAPPTQLDIDWSPVLTKSNERILKCENLVVYSSPAPNSPTSRNGAAGSESGPAETPGKLSRLFGATTTKKRQRLVMVTSAARLVLAPSGGEKKEAKTKIELCDPDVSYKAQQDAKGYTVWTVSTTDKDTHKKRDRTLTFEDSKANTGDSGSSARATQEWLDILESAREFHSSQSISSPSTYPSSYPPNGLSPTSPVLSNEDRGEGDRQGRAMLRKAGSSAGGRGASEESLKGGGSGGRGKRFSKRHSKNGLAAVF
ncbi:MAG: pkb-activating kinase-like protein [Chrysothrix sp. TS-e1954]|nr:MAG: pkb-activating kinase-like protein [Chrysothrix sp. TS-e1954]